VNNGLSGRVTGSKLGDADKASKECTEVEAELMELHAAYDQYFLGLERRPPTPKHTAFKKRLNALRNTFVNSTPVKFRIQNLQQRATTFERLWERTLMEIEAGTYKRDLFKARRHNELADRRKKLKLPTDELDNLSIDEDLDVSDLDESAATVAPVPSIAPSVPGVAPAVKPLGAPSSKPPGGPPMPAGAAKPAPSKPPAPVASEGGLNDQKIRAIYDAYVMAKRRCGEDVSKLSLDTVATTLRSQVPTLMKQHNAKSVEFKVVIKDGKAVLRALPKE
jgi:hypothetical protein